MANMELSPQGLEFIKRRESCRLKAYKDAKGVWTIGWGHTGQEVTPLLECTQAQADTWLEMDARVAANQVNWLVQVELVQHEFDALVSFVYNVGADIDPDTVPEGLGDSTLLQYLNAGLKMQAALQFLEWIFVGSGISRGLVRRRAKETLLFLKGTYL